MLALLLVALSVGLDNFGAAAAIGVGGIDRRLRLRIAVVFGAFEATMPVVGLLAGNAASQRLGSASNIVAGAVLCVVGLYGLASARRAGKDPVDPSTYPTRRLFVLGAALSIDNVAVGFALGSDRVSVLIAALTIGSVSVGLSLAGLELGARLGERLGGRSELVGGAMLIVVGLFIATGLL